MSVTDEVNAINTEFEKAASNHDLDMVLGFYAPDARVLAPNSPMAQGHTEIRAAFQAFLDAGLTTMELSSIDVLASGDLVVDVGSYRFGMQPPGSEPIEDVGKYVVALRRQGDGSLKIVVDTFNSDLPTG